MFYMKHKGTKLEITGDNVFTTCPQCGKEHSVDLQEIFFTGNADLYSTQVYCHKCSVERAKKHPEEPLAEMVAREDDI
ncbi:MAG: hypothetical protein VB096_10320 [Pseudoflavonifractor sp.]|nr:hypothetical protein [Pseudoflavonifractor sp.]